MTTEDDDDTKGRGTVDFRWIIGTGITLFALQLSVLGSVVSLYSRIATIETNINYLTIQQTRYDGLQKDISSLQQHVAIMESTRCPQPQQP